MLNILRADIYKAVRSPLFWCTFGLVELFLVSTAYGQFSYYALVVLTNNPEIIPPSADGIPDFFNVLCFLLHETIFLLGSFAVMFAVNEFSHGTIKNIASKGYRRAYIYLSKFITAIGFAVFSLVLQVLTAFVIAKIVIKNTIPNYFELNNDSAKELGFTFLKIVAYLSIAIFLAFLIRSSGPAIGSFLGFFFLKEMFINQIDNFIYNVLHSEFSIKPYTIYYSFNPEKISQGIIVLCTYILVFTCIGIYNFRKRDIN
ncbi:MAG TPA: hypothetical protein DCW90_18915 [Lachnospiraceae bacterium]|nr:hypothetical protein [Lachnospiraceae bacterium]